MNEQKYTLTVEFDSAYLLRTALTALELMGNSNEEFNVQDASDVSKVALCIWNAFWWSEKSGAFHARPAVMPNGFEARKFDQELAEWSGIAIHLSEAANNITRYLDKLEAEKLP